jgi:hypothetical protein
MASCASTDTKNWQTGHSIAVQSQKTGQGACGASGLPSVATDLTYVPPWEDSQSDTETGPSTSGEQQVHLSTYPTQNNEFHWGHTKEYYQIPCWKEGRVEQKAETYWASAVLIYLWSVHPLSNRGVLLMGPCCVIGKGTWCGHTWEPLGGYTRKNSQQKHS